MSTAICSRGWLLENHGYDELEGGIIATVGREIERRSRP